VSGVMDGNIDAYIGAYLRWINTKKDKE